MNFVKIFMYNIEKDVNTFKHIVNLKSYNTHRPLKKAVLKKFD